MEHDSFALIKTSPCFIMYAFCYYSGAFCSNEWWMKLALTNHRQFYSSYFDFLFGSSFFHKSLFSVKREIFLFSSKISVGNLSTAFIGITYTFAKIMFMLVERHRGLLLQTRVRHRERNFHFDKYDFRLSLFRAAFPRKSWIPSHLLWRRRRQRDGTSALPGNTIPLIRKSCSC